MTEEGTDPRSPSSSPGAPSPEPQQPREPNPPLNGIWTRERQSLYAALLKQDPTIGGLYELAVDGMDPARWSMPRLVTVAHCVREIWGALPHILGIDGLPPRSDTSAAGRELSRVWDEYRDELGPPAQTAAIVDDTAEPEQPKALVPRNVPGALLAAAAAYVVADVEGSRNARKVRGALVTGLSTRPIPTSLRSLERRNTSWAMPTLTDRSARFPLTQRRGRTSRGSRSSSERGSSNSSRASPLLRRR